MEKLTPELGTGLYKPSDKSGSKIRFIITGDVSTIVVHPRDSILEAFEKMNLHNVGRILVVNPENPKKLVGIITRTDILKALIKR